MQDALAVSMPEEALLPRRAVAADVPLAG